MITDVSRYKYTAILLKLGLVYIIVVSVYKSATSTQSSSCKAFPQIIKETAFCYTEGFWFDLRFSLALPFLWQSSAVINLNVSSSEVVVLWGNYCLSRSVRLWKIKNSSGNKTGLSSVYFLSKASAEKLCSIFLERFFPFRNSACLQPLWQLDGCGNQCFFSNKIGFV